MARTDNLTNYLSDIATAIKNKKGDSTPILASNFDTEIANLPSGGAEKPEVGFTVDEWDAEGYATKVTVYGMTSIPSVAFGLYNQTQGVNILNKNLKEVVLPNNVVSIGARAFTRTYNLEKINLPDTLTTISDYAFSEDSKLVLTELPDSITKISSYAFQKCSKLALNKLPSSLTGTLVTSVFGFCSNIVLKTLPDGVTAVGQNAFEYCTGLRQMSMNNVTSIAGSNTTNCSFRYCSNMKAFWIGSAITTLQRYALYTTSSLLKVYINKPRAEVEAIANYEYAFMNDATKQGIIICNDDADFITKEEFDAIDWATLAE